MIPAIWPMPSQTMQGHTESIKCVVHLTDGQQIITCSWDGSLRRWDLGSGTQIGDDWRDEGNNTGVLTMALSPNSKTFASGSEDGTVKLWDVKTGEVIARWTEHTQNVESVCWSPNGERVLSGSWDGTVGVWGVGNGEIILGPIKTEQQQVFAVAYSPDGSNFATGGFYGVKTWDGSTGDLLSTLEHRSTVWSLAWTSDGKKLISGLWNGSIEIVDTVTLQQIAVLQGHTIAVTAITLSCNGRVLASTSWDYTARLWDLETNCQVGPSLRHEKYVRCAAFSADGTRLVTGCDDTNAYMWDVGAILKEHHLEHLLPISDVSVK